MGKKTIVLVSIIATIMYVRKYEKNYHCEDMTTRGALFFGLFTLYKSWNCNNVAISFLSVFITWHTLHLLGTL